MPPILHAEYSPTEAVAAFDPPSPVEWYCDGEFAVLPRAVLCFITTGPRERDSQALIPSSVVWRPADTDLRLGKVSGPLPLPDDRESPVDRYPWIPRPVRDVYSADRKEQLREHHLFFRTPGDRTFVYAGPAHLGCLGDGRGGKAAGFTLATKLPRGLWLRLGGYPGWSVEVNHKLHLVDPDNIAAFDALLGKLTRKKFSHLTMTRYEEDSLTLHTGPDRGWLMYLRSPADSGLTARDPNCPDPDRELFFQCACGIDLETTLGRTLPRDQAAEVARELFLTGRLPADVPWAADRG